MILLDILTTRAALALAQSESADWLTRPCGGAQPDEFTRDCNAERARGFGEVEIIIHHTGSNNDARP